jgi:hypothetical protein
VLCKEMRTCIVKDNNVVCVAVVCVEGNVNVTSALYVNHCVSSVL